MAKISVMLLCCNRGLSDRKMTPKAVVDALADAGVTGLEPAPTWCWDEPELWDELKRAASDRGMAWSCCDCMVNFIGDGSKQALQEALDKVAAYVEFCRELGCARAMLPGTKPADGMTNEDGRRIYGEMLAKAAEQNAGSGVTLLIEDFGVYPHFTASGAHCAEVLDIAGDDVKFTFDNGNFLLGGDLPAECYGLFRSRIEHVHVKDFRVRTPDGRASLVSPAGVGYEGCPIGDGDAQAAGCMKLLRADDYDGWLSIEAGGYENVDAAIQGAEFIQENWAE